MSEALRELSSYIAEMHPRFVVDSRIEFDELTVVTTPENIVALLTFLRDDVQCGFVNLLEAQAPNLLLTDPVPVVSFTFGLPGGDVIARLKKAGTIVVQTVTNMVEATAAAEAGADLVVAQAGAAGGHSGTFTPDRPLAGVAVNDLVAEVSATVNIPVIAAGGLASAEAVSEVLGFGAVAAAVGTVLLRADESAASPTHKAALIDPARNETVLTRAFTGRPARGLRNAFIDRFEAGAPLGYPAIHHLTSPLRKAAAAAGVDDLVHLWAGTGYRRGPVE